jgi:hypothetical protein
VVVDGLDMGDRAEEFNGVRWGSWAVSVTWPPVNNHLEAFADTPVEQVEFAYPPGELPETCEAIARFVSVELVHDYVRGLGENYGGLYLANSGELVLQVTDDPELHRQALATGDAEACVIQISPTEAELQQIASDLQAKLVDLIPYGAATGSGSGGRVDVVVPVADLDTVRKIPHSSNSPKPSASSVKPPSSPTERTRTCRSSALGGMIVSAPYVLICAEGDCAVERDLLLEGHGRPVESRLEVRGQEPPLHKNVMHESLVSADGSEVGGGVSIAVLHEVGAILLHEYLNVPVLVSDSLHDKEQLGIVFEIGEEFEQKIHRRIIPNDLGLCCGTQRRVVCDVAILRR